ncbi:MAG: site-specific DNA-methyltransferase [Gudongella sp.]|nr:site-specific DNA-methyltransferase [Gudongella sp.]
MESILEIHNAIKTAEKKASIIIIDALESNCGLGLDLVDQTNSSNSLFYMDNIDAIKKLISSGYSELFDLIYLDPPFFTNLVFNKKVSIDTPNGRVKLKIPVYSDSWGKDPFQYLEMITIRLILMRELLSEVGTIYVHIDWRMVHYIRIILDYVFGNDRFLNEIIWAYKSGGAGRRSFSKKHDNILVYTKTKNYIFNISKEKSYNRDFKPYKFKNIKEYKDEKGWFTLVNSKDVWNIDMVGRTSSERVDYATQKPYKLLEKIVLTSSNKESLIGDFFAGSGTSLIVANNLQRRWIGSDNSLHSFIQIKKRLKFIAAEFESFSEMKKESIKELKGIKAMKIDSFFEIDLSNIEVNLENDLNINLKNNDVENIEFLKENAYLLLDYISIFSSSKSNKIEVEFFRPEINSKLLFTPIDKSLNNVYIETIDIWGNKYFNNIDGRN